MQNKEVKLERKRERELCKDKERICSDEHITEGRIESATPPNSWAPLARACCRFFLLSANNNKDTPEKKRQIRMGENE